MIRIGTRGSPLALVQAGAVLKLRSRASQNTGKKDKDALVLTCRP